MTRRDVLIAAAGGLALAAVDPGPAFAQGATVSGVVFEDRDGSGDVHRADRDVNISRPPGLMRIKARRRSLLSLLNR